MTDVEKQIQDRLSQEADADFEGAQDLIDAHIDEVSGGKAFSQLVALDPRCA